MKLHPGTLESGRDIRWGMAGLLAGLALSVASPVATANPITWAGNGHTYDIVTSPGITWSAANAAVPAGWTLATLTSAEENRWVYDNIVLPAFGTGNGGNDGVQAWLGGSRPAGSDPVTGWGWVTGEAWSYTNWGSGEPNNSGAGEFGLTINRLGNWTWNDEGAWPGGVKGYVIERVSDGGSTVTLLGIAIAAFGCLRRKLG